LIQRPRFKNHLNVSIVDSDKVFIGTEESHFLIESPAVNTVARVIGGGRELDEVVAESAGVLPITAVMAAVNRLVAGGHVVDGPTLSDAAETSWWDHRGINPSTAASSIRRCAIEITDLTESGTFPLSTVIAGCGFETSSSKSAETHLSVVVVDDHLDERLAIIDERFRESGEPWILVAPFGESIKIGPLFVPDVTACWQCMEMRMRGNRQLDSYLERKRSTTVHRPAVAPSTAATQSIAAGIVASELMTFAGGGTPTTQGFILSMDTINFQSETHCVIKRPQCPACGDVSLAKPPPQVRLRPAPKRFTADGGHRVERPEETFERLIRHVSPLSGAVSSLKRQTINDDGVTYSYASGHNFALMQDSTYFLRKNLRGRSGGKGRTDVQAKVGAICEAIERYSGVFRGDEPRQRARYAELDRAIHPSELLGFSDLQYEQRDEWNAANLSTYHIVPERFDEQRDLDWTTAWSLRDDEPRLVPTGFCYFGHPDIAEHFFCASDANGNAAGNTLEEAILQGLLEVVERDAAAIWWYNRLRMPAVDLDAMDEPYVSILREHYEHLDRSLWILDLTTDLGIPVFAGVSQRHGGPTEDILIGFGAHLDPHMAAMRALTELNQFLPAVCERSADGATNYWLDDPDAIEWWMNATVATETYVLPDENSPPVDIRRYDGLASDDLADDVRTCVESIARAGHEVIVLDQSRPDLDLSVAKVMVPGLRHFWRRLGPGRLYDAPLRMARRDTPLNETEMNPRSVFF
jgi:ribosomal protein S12 methylthiotransferase accessory factor